MTDYYRELVSKVQAIKQKGNPVSEKELDLTVLVDDWDEYLLNQEISVEMHQMGLQLIDINLGLLTNAQPSRNSRRTQMRCVK